MSAARDFIRCLLQVDPTKRMSLTHALNHPWLDSSAASDNGTTQPSPTTGNAFDLSLSDVSELSEFPEDNQNMGANGDASMLSAAPSSDDMPGVDLLNINSPAKSRAWRRLERHSRVLAREAEAEAQAASENAGSQAPSVGFHATFSQL